jgi:hypothetical protein
MNKYGKSNQIGVMSVVHEGRKPFGKQTYFFEDMCRSVENEDVEIFFFSPMNWKRGEKEVPGYYFVDNRWIAIQSAIPKIIYDRAFSNDEDQKAHLDRFRAYLKACGKSILNPLELADLLNNKVDFHRFLMKNNIPTLGTFPFTVLKNSKFFDTIGTSRVYVKPTFGSKGEGIFVIEKRENKYQLIDHLGAVELFKDYVLLREKLLLVVVFPDRYFVQEEAKIELLAERPFDIRVLVQNYGNDYKVTGMAVRAGLQKGITSNLNSGGDALPMEELDDFFISKYGYTQEVLRQKIEKLCLDCSEVLKRNVGDFCEIGFDILVTRDKGPIIIEGNAKPSRWVFVKMADYLENRGKDNSYYLERRKETVSVPMKYARYLITTQD